MQISKPPRLKPGDVVGVVAPSYEVASRRSVVEQGFQRLAAYGFQIREGKHLWSRLTGRAATRAEQLADLHNLWADPAVKDLLCHGWSHRHHPG